MRSSHYHNHVGHIEGRESITDEEIRQKLREGWFLNQIRHRYKCSLERLRKIDREMTGEP